ncbi:DUF6114 domain-containing protein [Streptodolium elevatio]|uniref:DUF6114 domain-containing protein n=1 Tax=Streptodolium elevatio TaxID=3157996 RepID=A0ABV3DBF1_9ACTN
MSTSKPHEPGKSEAERPQSGREKRLRGPFKQERRRIAEWRRGRPFWAGFFILLGALPILYFPYATLQVGDVSVAMSTMAGAAAAVIGCVLILMGLMVWFQPQFRIYAGVTALVCGFISFVTSNLGGFFMGLLSVTIGGSLALAWSYDEDEGEVPAEDADGATGAGPSEAEEPREDPGAFAAPDDAAAPGGAGLGEPSAGSATSRPGSTPDAHSPDPHSPDALDASARTLGGVAKFGAIAGFPAVALVAALLPMAGPSEPLPPNPFADGPCVSASPSAPSTATATATASASASASATGAPSPTSGTPTAKAAPPTGSPATPSPTAKSTPPAAVSPAPGTAAKAPAAAPTTAGAVPPAAPVAPPAPNTPAPAATTQQPGGLLGPLLDPLLDPLRQLVPPFLRPPGASTPPPVAAPPAAAADPAPPPSAPASPPVAQVPPTAATAPASAPATPKAAPATTESKTAPTTSAKPSTATATAPATATPTPTATTAPAPTGSKAPYPCPEQVPLDAAPAAPGEPVLPDEPWILKTSLLAMAGMDYKGVVDVRTGSGKTKPVLKFEVSGGVDIWNLDMTSPVDGKGNRIHVFSVDNVKSYMKDGTVTFYTESLKGNLFGLIPIEFTPTSPPPLNVPVAFFTDVTVRQAGQTGATLVIPDLTMRSEKAS